MPIQAEDIAQNLHEVGEPILRSASRIDEVSRQIAELKEQRRTLRRALTLEVRKLWTQDEIDEAVRITRARKRSLRAMHRAAGV